MNYVFRDLMQFWELAAVLAVWLGFAQIGGLFSYRKPGPLVMDIVYGWSAVALFFTLGGVFFKLSFSLMAYGFFAISFLAGIWQWRKSGRLLAPGLGRLLMLAVPLLIMVSAMRASQWDEFSHWLFSARYLLENDGFPGHNMPQSLASFPAYPYSWPLVSFLSGKLAGHFIEQAGAISNVVLLIAYALVILRLARGDDGSVAPPWHLLGLGLLAVTILNPTFVEKLVFTAYADLPTGIGVGLGGALGWRISESLRNQDGTAARSYALRMGLVLALLVSVKQANLALALLLVGAAFLLVLRDGRFFNQDAALSLLIALSIPALMYLSWRYHVSRELVGQEFIIRPFDQWSINLIPAILARMASVAAKKGVFFGLMLILAGCSLYWLVKPRPLPAWRMAALAGFVFLGYDGFLLFTYVASFGAQDALNVVSFWRYNTHLGLLGLLPASMFMAYLIREKLAGKLWVERLKPLPIFLILLMPLALAKYIRFDVDPQKTYIRETGRAIAPLLPVESKLFVVDPLGSGLSGKMIDYETAYRTKFMGHLSAFDAFKPEIYSKFFVERGVTHVWVHTLNQPVAELFGLPEDGRRSYLLERKQEGWREVAHWPYPKSFRADKVP
jgi:hypothetical protein